MSVPLMSPARGVPRRGITRADIAARLVVLGIIAVIAPTAAGTLWLAGQLAALATHGVWPASAPGDAPGILLRLANHTAHPGQAWPPAARPVLPGARLLYPTWVVLFVATLVVLLAAGARVGRRVARRTGFARRSDLRRVLTADAVLARVDVVRPGLALTAADNPDTRAAKLRRRRDPLEVARFLGNDAQSGRPLYLANEYSELGEGTARFAGKTTRYVIPRVLDARGAVISTSTRLDVAEVTFDIRQRVGPSFIFEPQGTVPGVPRMRWSPIHGCEDMVVAMLRASGFASGSGIGDQSVENGKWFQDQAASIIRGLLHAAALDGAATMTDVMAWAQNPTNSRPEKILRHHDAHAWADRLSQHREQTGRTRDTIQAVLTGALDAFNDPRVLAACSPPRGEEFRPGDWLAERGTLYLVGTRDAQTLVAPLFSALIEDIIFRARQAALLAPGGRVEPCLYFIGDEISNIAPIPSLPSLMSEGGGAGIATSVFCQNSHQLQQRWGKDGGRAIEAAANARLLMGGSNDVAGLRDMQALAGQVNEVSSGATWGGGRASVNENTRREALLDLAELRTLPTGHALVMVGNLPPLEVRMPAWWQRHDAGALHAARAAFTARLAQAGG
ncbi:MAG TPA: TraM recognition domain-containing protein [Rugosimonospora sp.]|nr:TraM recognition domain-containing protein [Rugosimonospora sp.]